MNQNPTLKVLSSMKRHGVRCLLMGGQACVFYGAAEFSRDVDFVLLAKPDNLKRLQSALDELEAEIIAIPPFDESFLNSGLAVHFRCNASGVEGLRIDIMTVMRGVDPFPMLWERRTTFAIDETEVDLLSLPDLVKAKKTQRSKDWPMLQRLIEAHWFQHRFAPTPERIGFEQAEAHYRAGAQGLRLSEIPQLPQHLRELSRLSPVDRAGRKALRNWAEEHSHVFDEDQFRHQWKAQGKRGGAEHQVYHDQEVGRPHHPMIPFHEAMNSKGWLRRSVIDSAARHLCGIALGIALISPADFLKQLP